MIDIEMIREKYASMADGQLIHLAKEDSQGLTEEALTLLKQEFSLRGMNLSSFLPAKEEQVPAEEEQPIDGFYNTNTYGDDSLLGRNYMAMPNPAKEKALAENKEKFLASLTQKDLQKLVRKCENFMFYGGITCIIGFAITIGSLLIVADNKEGTNIIAWGAIIFGGVRFITAANAKSRYEERLKNINIANEEIPGEDH